MNIAPIIRAIGFLRAIEEEARNTLGPEPQATVLRDTLTHARAALDEIETQLNAETPPAPTKPEPQPVPTPQPEQPKPEEHEQGKLPPTE